jgi:adenine phosphoribosyltransferase
MDLKQYIREIPDFPEPGVMFRDITPLLRNAEAFQHAVGQLTDLIRGRRLSAVVGIESRGFLFAAPLALDLGLPLIPVRRAGKLPSARMSVEYALEYGTGQMDIHSDALERSDSVVIVDDLLATGGTAMAAAKLVELLGAQVEGFAFVVELDSLGGRERLSDYDAVSLIRYK